MEDIWQKEILNIKKNLKHSNFFIYSPMKTATQSLNKIFNTHHVHHFHNNFIAKEEIIDILQKRVKNGNKIIFISSVRNTFDRICSVFFQTNHEIDGLLNGNINDTIIVKNDVKELINIFIKDFNQGVYFSKNSFKEIFDDLILFFNINLNKIEHRGNYLYLNTDLFEMYFFKFEDVISNKLISMCKDIFRNNFKEYNENLTSNKIYHSKYKEFVKEIKGNIMLYNNIDSRIKVYSKNWNEIIRRLDR